MSTWRRWIALAVLVLPVLLISVDMTVLGFAVPALSEALSPSGLQLLWIIDIYSFLLAGLLVLMGNLGDRIGRRRLLMIGAAAFGAASLLAAWSTSAEMLIAARALLGVGGATLMPSTLSLLRTVFTDARQRRLAIAVWAAAFAGGAALGPVLGGFLLQHFWWGSVFLINAPIMVLILVGAIAFLPESRNPHPGPFDALSAALSIAGILPLVFGLKTIGKDGPTPLAVAALLAGGVVLWLFLRRQRTLAQPLLDVGLFRHRAFSVAVVTNLLSVFALLGVMFFLPQYLQLVLGMSPLRAGLWMLPLAIGTVAGALTAPRLARSVPIPTIIGGGMLLAATGLALGVLLNSAPQLLLLGVASVLIGGGIGMAETLTNDVILSTAPPERAGSAAAISETAYEFGGAMGVALLGTLGLGIYRSRLLESSAHLPPEVLDAAAETLGGAGLVAEQLAPVAAEQLLVAAREAFTSGMGIVFAVAALVSAYSGIQALVVLRRRRRQAPEAVVPVPADPRLEVR